MRVKLPLLDERIERRAAATRERHSWWPCAEGCDLCCRSLPHLPVITEPEWRRISESIAALPSNVREMVVLRTHTAPETGPLACPLLELGRGTCLVYSARPIACRTYGFYTERDAGLHCARITRAVCEHGAEEAVVWGNGEAIADDMAALGPLASLREWMSVR